MDNLKNIIDALPPMLTSKDLTEALSILPEYDRRICEKSEAERLIALSDLYRVYLPSPMSAEVYSKLYLALLRSLQKKITKEAICQKNENFKTVRRQEYSSILGGADSFTIIGTSGIGKSAAISRAISLITESGIIEVKKPFAKIIPCIVLQCPFDSSVKGLLLEILRKVDEQLGSKYYHNALKAEPQQICSLVLSVRLRSVILAYWLSMRFRM